MNKKSIALLCVLILTLVTFAGCIGEESADSLANSNPSEGTEKYVTGTVTDVQLIGGAGVCTLDNVLTIRFAMSTPNADKLLSGEIDSLRAKVVMKNNNWIVQEIEEA